MQEKCRDCRKFGTKLFLKGDKCISPNCSFTRRSNRPGTAPIKGFQSGRRRKKSEYGLQLEEKQKAKAEYGLRERQFRTIFKKAAKEKEATGEAMLRHLELRLDNVVYRLGWASSRSQAKQLVSHNHIKVNGKIIDVPSAIVKSKDKIEPSDLNIVKKIAIEKVTPPKWLKLEKNFVATVASTPTREEIDTPIDEQLIVEYYSR